MTAVADPTVCVNIHQTSELQERIDYWRRNQPTPGTLIYPTPGAPASLNIQKQDSGSYRLWICATVPHHLPYIQGECGWYVLPPGCTGGLQCIVMPRNRDEILLKCKPENIEKVTFEAAKVIRWSRKGTSVQCELVNWSISED